MASHLSEYAKMVSQILKIFPNSLLGEKPVLGVQ
jgi:hypothetical protein